MHQRYLPRFLSTCVSKSILLLVKRWTLACASWSNVPGHLDAQMGQHQVRVSVAELKPGIPSFRRGPACLHTTGYFRGDSLQKSHLKTRKIIVLKWNELKSCEHSNRSPKNVRLDSLHLRSPAGQQPGWAVLSYGQILTLGPREGWSSCRSWAQKEISSVPSVLLINSDITDRLRKRHLGLFLHLFWMVLFLV